MNTDAFLVFLAEIVSTFCARHPDYSLLAGRVYASYHHGRIPKQFSSWVLSIEHAQPGIFSDRLLAAVHSHADALDGAILHSRDFDFTYRALQIFERSYLLKSGREVNERLQFLFMRVAIGIHGDAIDDVLQTYHLLSTRKISLASPALWNGGLSKRRFASCYIFEPSVTDAADAIRDFSTLSLLWSSDGGIGINVGSVPGSRGTGDGAHPGLMPLLKTYDSIAAFWSRTSHHRTSSATAFLPIWHTDVSMRRLDANEMWTLLDPMQAPGLDGLYGDAFDCAYEAYEAQGLATSTLPARVLWDVIADGIRESGTPFLMYGDNVNAKNNQMNLGPIGASNLCTEIVQYSSTVETAVCTLASICLPRYLRGDGTLDYAEIHRVTKLVVRYLDRLIDLNDYPTTESAVSAYRTRSLSVGVQGLADLLGYMEVPFTSLEGRAINSSIFETVYHAALESSCELAEQFGPHDSWQGSPAQQGVLQIDMWGAEPSDRYDFDSLRENIRRNGLRNSVLTAQMPTASTAQLFGNSEGTDPHLSNILQFRVLGGNFNEISRPLVVALHK
uniref:Ribonucleoside-diphosphate reductase n=1 Tax=Ganoderma boninense TaxID=34458 RepID=A0A5K1K000_9APHY|nr:N/A [Ganoderma boninense]